MEVYAKWDSRSVIYHNGNGVSFVQSVDSASTSVTALAYQDVVKAKSDFERAGKTFVKWTASPDGAGSAVTAGDTLTFAANEVQKDLYAQFTDNAYTVAFSANGGTFGANSVFKQNPDVFEITTDNLGGEVAVVKQKAKYNDTLHTVLGSFDYNKITPKNADASRTGSTLSDATNWAIDAEGNGSLRFDDYKIWWFTIEGENPAITSDVTYYLKWKDDPGVTSITGDISLGADMWGVGKSSPAIDNVKKGDAFSVTGAVDVTAVKSQMQEIEKQFPNQASTPENIKLTGTTSTFTAKFTAPDGITVPAGLSADQVKVQGLGTCFEVKSVQAEGQTVTVTFGLKDSTNFTTYKELKEAVDSTGGAATPGDSGLADAITITINGLGFAEGVTNSQELTTVGEVSGTFASVASVDGTAAKASARTAKAAPAAGQSGSVKRFTFNFNGGQTQSGKDAAGANGITYTVRAVVPIDADLPGDILIGDDTEHDAVPIMDSDKLFAVTGALNVQSIRDQMSAIEAQYPNASQDQIAIELADCTFTASFTVPEGLKVPASLTADELTTSGFGNESAGFEVKAVEVSGQTVKVTMGLRGNVSDYVAYTQLKDAVYAAGENGGTWMKLTVPGVTFDSAKVENGDRFTLQGEISGKMSAKATYNGSERKFLFNWKGAQWADGKDVTQSADDNGIQYTLEVAKLEELDLPGDMLVGTNTEHDAVIGVKAGGTVDITGAVNVTGVKQQMESIEAKFPNVDTSGIKTNVKSCSFTAQFTVPDGMELPDNLTVDLLNSANTQNFAKDGCGFDVKSVSVQGKTVTIQFGLLGETSDYTLYPQLKEAVNAAGDNDGWMKITIPGVKISADLADGTQLTSVGQLAGSMRAIATSGATSHGFNFAWTTSQWPEGRDAAADETDNTIRLTVKVTKAEVPQPPVTPVKPTQPDNPVNHSQANAGQTDVQTDVSPITGDSLGIPIALAAIVAIVAVALAVVALVRQRNKRAAMGAHARKKGMR